MYIYFLFVYFFGDLKGRLLYTIGVSLGLVFVRFENPSSYLSSKDEEEKLSKLRLLCSFWGLKAEEEEEEEE